MNATQQGNTKTQLEKANEVLKGLAINVSTDDRKAAEEELGYSRFTIGAYLKGEGKDQDTAMKLIDFFRPRIEDRDKKLQQPC